MTAPDAGQATTRCWCWRVERCDGVTLGFTTHDTALFHGGLTYRPSPGMTPGSVLLREGLEAGGLDIKGALDAADISEDDLQAGRWDRAAIEIWDLDWTAPDTRPQLLAAGELGEISFGANGFEAELFGPADLLARRAVPLTSPGCRAAFCGEQCGLNSRRFSHVGTMRLFDPLLAQFHVDGVVLPDGDFAFGSVEWLSGPARGLTGDIAGNEDNRVRLTLPPGVDPGQEARIRLREGCDHRIETCANRFGNAINFRGEPYLPGNDLLARYPQR